MITKTIRPHCLCCPMVMRDNEQLKDEAGLEDVVDPKHALREEPIIGMENVTWEDGKGAGARPAKPLPSPKTMSEAQRRTHDLTPLQYDPGCPICVPCRRPNDHHRGVKDSAGTIPLMVADYGFPQHSDDDEALTLLIMRVYPYKFICAHECRAQDETLESLLGLCVLSRRMVLLTLPTEATESHRSRR